MFKVDIPEVQLELSEVFDHYERALVTNDIATLNEFFWNDARALRYGARQEERLYGHTAIARFRISRGSIDQRRNLCNRFVTTFGRDFGVTNTEFMPVASDMVGRQSQTWIRTELGWKIVSAHVSFETPASPKPVLL